MHPLAYVAALVITMAIAFAQMLGKEVEAHGTREAKLLATNASIYLGHAKEYVRTHPGFSGQVPDASLGLPSWYTRFAEVNCYAAGGVGYLTISGTTDQQAYEAAMELDPQYSYGKNVGGVVHTNSGESFTVPSQVPASALVVKF